MCILFVKNKYYLCMYIYIYISAVVFLQSRGFETCAQTLDPIVKLLKPQAPKPQARDFYRPKAQILPFGTLLHVPSSHEELQKQTLTTKEVGGSARIRFLVSRFCGSIPPKSVLTL